MTTSKFIIQSGIALLLLLAAASLCPVAEDLGSSPGLSGGAVTAGPVATRTR